MKRRKFIQFLGLLGAGLWSANKSGFLAQTISQDSIPAVSLEKLPEFSFNGLTYKDLHDFLEPLCSKKAMNLRLYMENLYETSITFQHGLVDISHWDQGLGCDLMFASNEFVQQWNSNQWDLAIWKEELEGMMLLRQEVAANARPKSTPGVPRKIADTTTTSAANDSAALLGQEENKTPEILRFTEIKDFREKTCEFGPSDLTLEDRIEFLKRLDLYRQRIMPEIDGFKYRWRDWEKLFSVWFTEPGFTRDRTFWMSWDVELERDRWQYSYPYGGYQNAKEMIQGEGLALEGLFQNMKEQIERLEKLPFGSINPNLYPVVLAPGNNALLWAQGLFPYFSVIDKDSKSRLATLAKDFPNTLTIQDDPRSRIGKISMVIDDDGYLAKNYFLIQNGELNLGFIDRLGAWKKLEGVNGRTRRMNYRCPPVVAPTNFTIAAGSDRAEDLLKAYPSVIWVERIDIPFVDQKTGNFTASIPQAIRYQQGVPRERLKDLVMAGNIFEITRSIKGVGNDFFVDNSRGYYYNNQQKIATSYGMPSILVSNVLLTYFKRS